MYYNRVQSFIFIYLKWTESKDVWSRYDERGRKPNCLCQRKAMEGIREEFTFGSMSAALSL